MKFNKNIKHNRRILDSRGFMPLPKQLIFEPTLSCNLCCPMCERFQQPSLKKNEDIHLNAIISFVETLPKTIKRVYISGGEPFMRKDIIEICRIFLKKGLHVMIQTNGTFVNKTIELSKLKGIKIIFSLDGPSKVHNKIRGQASVYEKTVKLLREFKKNKKNITITSVITDENIDVMSRFVKNLYKEKLKPDYWIIELARRYTKKVIEKSAQEMGIRKSDFPIHLKNSALPAYSYQKFENKLMQLDKELKRYRFKYCYYPENLLTNKKEFYFRNYRKKNELYCTHLEDLRVDNRGEIIPCFAIRKSFGNVSKYSIRELWNSEEFMDFRVKLIKNNLLPVCETCYRAKNKNTLKGYYDNWFYRSYLAIRKKLHPNTIY